MVEENLIFVIGLQLASTVIEDDNDSLNQRFLSDDDGITCLDRENRKG